MVTDAPELWFVSSSDEKKPNIFYLFKVSIKLANKNSHALKLKQNTTSNKLAMPAKFNFGEHAKHSVQLSKWNIMRSNSKKALSQELNQVNWHSYVLTLPWAKRARISEGHSLCVRYELK